MAPAPGTQTAGPEFHVRIASAGRLFRDTPWKEAARSNPFAVMSRYSTNPVAKSLRALIGLVRTP